MLKLITDEDLKYNLDEIARLGAKKKCSRGLNKDGVMVTNENQGQEAVVI